MGYKDATIASTRFRQIKKKLGLEYKPSSAAASGSGAAVSPLKSKDGSKPKSPTKATKVTKPGTIGRGRGRPRKDQAVQKSPIPKKMVGVQSQFDIHEDDEDADDEVNLVKAQSDNDEDMEEVGDENAEIDQDYDEAI